jgi:hypothetical protein
LCESSRIGADVPENLGIGGPDSLRRRELSSIDYWCPSQKVLTYNYFCGEWQSSNDEERESLLKLNGCGKSSARKVNPARILLLTDKEKVD